MNNKGSNKEKIPKEVTLDNYNSLNDYLFFKYMFEKGNELQQKTFLKSLGINIKGKLKILNETIAPEIINKKKCVLDFLAETDNMLINIELQQEATKDFIQRIVYYMAKLVRLNKGNPYKIFRDVIVISIINYKMKDIDFYETSFQLRNDSFPHNLLTGKLKIIFLSLKEFKKVKKDLNNKKHLYLSFFSKETSHNERKEMSKMDNGLKVAVKRIEEAIHNDEELRIYHKVELEKAIEEKRELKLKDVEEKLKESETKLIGTVKLLKEKDVSIEKISEVTGLPIEKIKKL